MYAWGNHFKVRSDEKEKVTYNSGIASNILKACRRRGSRNPGLFETTKYIGWIEEILELEYQSHCCIVLVCSWVHAYPQREACNVICDRYGFTVGNFQNTMPLGAESFAFPSQCQQVFFSDDIPRSRSHGRDWKVVRSTNIQGR